MRGKIGIITLTGYANYGQKFQNYAVKKILSDFCFDSTTFVVKEPRIIGSMHTLNRLFHDTFFNKQWRTTWRWAESKFKKLTKENVNSQDNKKFNKFKSFCEKYINESHINYKELSIIANNFDYFVVGSDQIWNPLFYKLDSTRFLKFVNKESRISLSPSFGVNKIPYYKKKIFKKCISDFKHLSVREHDGAKIIKELTGKEADILLDPTLSLNKEDWDNISVRVKNKPKKYILTYVLSPYSGCKDIIKDISNRCNLPVINVTDYKDFKKYDIGPSEFIDLIKSASLVITDSYHGTIFSIIYSIPFVISDNAMGDSRFKSLEKEFNIKSRFAKNISNKDLFNLDFKKNLKKMKNLKMKTYKFVKNVLDKKC